MADKRNYDFTTEEMIQRLAEFPPKALREKVRSESGKKVWYYSNTMEKEDIYNYVSNLPETEIQALFENAAKRGTSILKPCCNICNHHWPTMYEDIPGSHVSGWWIGGCELDEGHHEIGSSRYRTSPEWCPLRKEVH